MTQIPQAGALVEPNMQILGLSNSTPRTEGRLKALFWPSIRNEADCDYIAEQGFWVCVIVATATLVFSLLARSTLAGLFEPLFFFMAGIGVRQRSATASITAFVAYLLDAMVLQRYAHNGFGVVRIIFLALLLANVRGIWLSSRWRKLAPTEPPEIPSPRLNETFFDKLSGQFPDAIWPKIGWIFYILACLEIGTLLVSLIMPVGSI